MEPSCTSRPGATPGRPACRPGGHSAVVGPWAEPPYRTEEATSERHTGQLDRRIGARSATSGCRRHRACRLPSRSSSRPRRAGCHSVTHALRRRERASTRPVPATDQSWFQGVGDRRWRGKVTGARHSWRPAVAEVGHGPNRTRSSGGVRVPGERIDRFAFRARESVQGRTTQGRRRCEEPWKPPPARSPPRQRRDLRSSPA